MKQYKISLMLVVLLGLTFNNCNEATVELEPIGSTEASFFQNEDEMTQGILGIYQKLNFFYQWGNDRVLHRIWLLPSDDLTNNGGMPHEIFSSLNGNDGSLRSYFQFAYQLIARANTMLEKIAENGPTAYPADSDADQWHKGEALFLRAWMHFRLWNTFGTAPLVTERIKTLDDALVTNSTGVQLIDQVIIDLQEAAGLLPAAWSDNNLGRVTSNSARGLLGKALVFRGTVTGNASDFTEAISVFNGITDRALTPHFNDNFNALKENNEESLFEFQANRAPGNTNPWVGGGNDAFAVIGEMNSYYGYFDNRGYGGNNRAFSGTASLMSAFEDGDPRRDFTVNPAEATHNILKYVIDSTTVYVNGRAGQGLSQNNTRILRYADVLLLKAEAIARSGGNLSEAVDLINQVRARARASTIDGTVSAIPADLEPQADAGTLLDIIFQERRVELAAEEGHRWYDLRRRHLAGELDLTKLDFSSVRDDFAFQEFNLNFPLPEEEVIQNPNLNQNSGY